MGLWHRGSEPNKELGQNQNICTYVRIQYARTLSGPRNRTARRHAAPHHAWLHRKDARDVRVTRTSSPVGAADRSGVTPGVGPISRAITAQTLCHTHRTQQRTDHAASRPRTSHAPRRLAVSLFIHSTLLAALLQAITASLSLPYRLALQVRVE